MPKLEQVNYKVFLSTRKNFVSSLAVSVVAALILLLALIPQIQQIFSIRSELEVEKPKLEKLDAKLAELDAVLFTPEYAQLDLVSEALPSKKPLLELLDSLNSAAQSSGVQITSFSINPGLVASDAAALAAKEAQKSNEDYDHLRLELKLTGQFQQIQNFMAAAERFAPFTSVTTFSLVEQNRDSGVEQFQPDAQVRTTMTTDTYFFTQSIKVTIDSALPKIGDTQRTVLTKLTELEASNLPSQNQIEGGGLEDLFGIEGYDFSNIQ